MPSFYHNQKMGLVEGFFALLLTIQKENQHDSRFYRNRNKIPKNQPLKIL
jgi:hypothetical protein